jgi:hypothetical protein
MVSVVCDRLFRFHCVVASVVWLGWFHGLYLNFDYIKISFFLLLDNQCSSSSLQHSVYSVISIGQSSLF